VASDAIDGICDAHLRGVREAFAENFAHHGEVGAVAFGMVAAAHGNDMAAVPRAPAVPQQIGPAWSAAAQGQSPGGAVSARAQPDRLLSVKRLPF
jgi:hypothetical protein